MFYIVHLEFTCLYKYVEYILSGREEIVALALPV